MISSDLYIINQFRANKNKRRWHLPTISVLIPAYNEEQTIERALQSVYDNDYPASKLEVIVANDGSTDNTKAIATAFKRSHKNGCSIRIINRPNRGKAHVMNYVLRRCTRSRLIMCLDADSYLHKNALRQAAQRFRNRNMVAVCSNVQVVEDGSMIALAQHMEYLMGFHTKRGLTQLGVNYIIGGAGSMFRRSMLKRVAYYESNTLTEDLDLTLNIIANKRHKEQIGYAANAIVYTEAVHTLRALARQRFRWGYGRAQVLTKYSYLFFSRDERHSKRLTWFMLPFSLIQDLAFFFIPITSGLLIYFLIEYENFAALGAAVGALAGYLALCIWSTENLTAKEKLRLIYYAPPCYVLFYLIYIVDYYSLVKTIILSPGLKRSLRKRRITWRSPERKGSAMPV